MQPTKWETFSFACPAMWHNYYAAASESQQVSSFYTWQSVTYFWYFPRPLIVGATSEDHCLTPPLHEVRTRFYHFSPYAWSEAIFLKNHTQPIIPAARPIPQFQSSNPVFSRQSSRLTYNFHNVLVRIKLVQRPRARSHAQPRSQQPGGRGHKRLGANALGAIVKSIILNNIKHLTIS